MRASLKRSDIHGSLARLFSFVLIWNLPASVLGAEVVYKSTDADGRAVYSDHPAEPSSEPMRLHVDAMGSSPPIVHFCWTNCFTLMLEGGIYRRTDGTDETWTIGQFTPTSVILHRHDAPAAWNGFKADVTYQGQASGDRLLNATVDGKPVAVIAMAWGAALDTLPGSNGERDHLRPAIPSASDRPTDLNEASTKEAPPPLANEDQPPCPAEGYLWNPGYWAWSGRRYHWVTGIWVLPPQTGLLWTPGYWEFNGTGYAFHAGYWGLVVGHYGGIGYGFGYPGVGFFGGRWVGNSFEYNAAVTHLNPQKIHHTYSEAVTGGSSRASYTGGTRATSKTQGGSSGSKHGAAKPAVAAAK